MRSKKKLWASTKNEPRITMKTKEIDEKELLLFLIRAHRTKPEMSFEESKESLKKLFEERIKALKKLSLRDFKETFPGR